MKKKNNKKITKTTTVTTTTVTTNADLKTHVAIVLDRSTSMSTIRAEAISVFNEQVDALKAGSKNIETSVSLFTFSTEADEPTLLDVPTTKLKHLTAAQYVPGGMTAMYDGVGKAIDHLATRPDANDPTTSFLVVIISDGQENCSKQYNARDIAGRISELQKTARWTFSYLGANQDLSKVSQTLNIPMGNTMSFQSSSTGTLYAANANSNATRRYMSNRAGGQSATMGFYQDQNNANPGVGSNIQIPQDTQAGANKNEKKKK